MTVLAVLLLLTGALSGCSPTAYDLGTRALDEGDPHGAIALFDESLALDEDRFQSLRERGAAYLETGDPERALTDLKEAQVINDHDARLHWLLGQANSELANYNAASESYRRYQMLVSNRSIRRLAGLRLAQLREDAAFATAENLTEARQLGMAPDPNTVALFAFRPYDQQDPSEEDLKVCRALSVWVSADLAKIEELRSLAPDALELLYEAQGTNLEQRWQLDPASQVVSGGVQPARHMVRGEYGAIDAERVIMLGVLYDSEDKLAEDFPVQEDELDQLFQMETRFVLDLLDLMGIVPTPEQREAIGEKPTNNRQAFMAYADGLYRLWDLGDLEGAQASFERAGSLDPGFTMALEGAALAEAKQNPDQVVTVPAPPQPQLQTERALASAETLGMGLIPDDEAGDGNGATTQKVVAARGTATIRVRAEITP